MLLLLFCAAILLSFGGPGTALPLENFYPFGTASNDLFLSRNDDGFSEPIVLNLPFPFFGTRHSRVFVSLR